LHFAIASTETRVTAAMRRARAGVPIQDTRRAAAASIERYQRIGAPIGPIKTYHPLSK